MRVRISEFVVLYSLPFHYFICTQSKMFQQLHMFHLIRIPFLFQFLYSFSYPSTYSFIIDVYILYGASFRIMEGNTSFPLFFFFLKNKTKQKDINMKALKHVKKGGKKAK
ncbi:hypothetical protein, unlikely [Trypanosoma brucei gambiense DAL972]|uniref:Uncharacterized protein n=1 Tax=Trypanosoma brucei gambiense (strain MHOM/CI/86/DAL972) TaxID=679716 RepID=D0A7H5_TRYB9|nr:hypothetical protein, unlikely [Trypanosoma brucei gambiense DAL972]CBH17626.1 hypothetical protein, unlikely [Trypanosoma brucei gambiense DAL972]|eukprot:XP_011779890.1 hypothetical protein, unlikely [Trypanosoma brucei gambiense DAL972]